MEPGATPSGGDRYTPLHRLGEGGMGIVERVRDEHLGRVVAMKTLRAEGRATASWRSRFDREARVTASLQHPSIVPVHDYGEDAHGALWFTMKEIAGRTLSEAIASVHAASPPDGWGQDASGWNLDRLMECFLRVCEAIAYAHAQGVIHRDLKPENVMVGEFGETVVLDWGLARPPGSTEFEPAELPGEVSLPDLPRATVVGRAMGTPAFMSPEQAAGAWDKVTPRSDVYSLGAILYTILCGKPPLAGTSTSILQELAEGRTVAPASVGAARVPRELSAIAARAMAVRPEGRYADASELAADVRRWLSGKRVSAYDYSLRELVRRFLDRHRNAVIVGSLAVTIVALGTSIFLVNLRMERDRALRAESRVHDEMALAQKNLHAFLVEQARSAEMDRLPTDAAIFGAKALTLADDPDARGAVLAAANATVPALLWQTTLRGDTLGGTLSPDGSRMVLTADNSVTLTRVGDPAPVTLDLGSLARRAEFSPDGSRVVIARQRPRDGDADLPVIEVATGRVVQRLVGHPRSVWQVLWLGGSRLIASGNGPDIPIWGLDAAEPERIIPGGSESGRALALSPDGQRFAVALSGGIELRDLSGRLLRTFADGGRTTAMAWPLPDRIVAVGGEADPVVHVWHTGDGEELRLRGHSGGVRAVVGWPDTRRPGQAMSAGADGTLIRWDVASGEMLERIRISDAGLRTISRDAAGTRLLTVAADGVARLWAVPATGTASELLGSSRAAVGLVPVDAPRGVLLVNEDGQAFQWDVATGSGGALTAPSLVAAVAAGADGIRWFYGRDGSITRDDPSGARSVVRPAGERCDADAAFPSPDGALVVFGCNHEYGRLVARDPDVTDTVLLGPDDFLDTVAWAPDGQRFVTIDLAQPELIRTWDRSGHPGPVWSVPGARPTALAWHPGGGVVAVGGADRQIHFLAADSGHELNGISGPLVVAGALAWSPDGRLLVAGASDGSIWVYAYPERAPVAHFLGTHGAADRVAFSTDAALLLTAHRDGVVRVWDLSELSRPGEELLQAGLLRLGMRLDGARLETDRAWTAPTW